MAFGAAFEHFLLREILAARSYDIMPYADFLEMLYGGQLL